MELSIFSLASSLAISLITNVQNSSVRIVRKVKVS